MKSDINEFEEYKYTFDDYLIDGDIEPFFKIFNTYTLRMSERINYLDTILTSEFDYTILDSVEVSREDAKWAENYFAMNQLWEKRIKSDAVNLKVNGKDWDEIVKNLSNLFLSP